MSQLSVDRQSVPSSFPAGEGQQIPIIGITHILKSHAADSATVLEVILRPGQGIPAHTHTHEDEYFCVLSGTLTCRVETLPDPVLLEADGMMVGPRLFHHAFSNESDEEVRLFITVVPGEPARRMFLEMAEACKRLTNLADQIVETTRICEWYGISFAPVANS